MSGMEEKGREYGVILMSVVVHLKPRSMIIKEHYRKHVNRDEWRTPNRKELMSGELV